MNEKTLLDLEEQADLYQQFMELEETERRWLKNLMGKSRKLTIAILKVIDEESHTFEEIAELVNCSKKTVSQKLNALYTGGFPVNLTETAAILETGRPRKLARTTNGKSTG